MSASKYTRKAGEWRPEAITAARIGFTAGSHSASQNSPEYHSPMKLDSLSKKYGNNGMDAISCI